VLLAPASASSRRSGGGSLVDRISQQWPEGEGAPAPRSEAVRLARDADAAAVAEEQEAKRLEREIDPQEAARLEKRLAALGAPGRARPAGVRAGGATRAAGRLPAGAARGAGGPGRRHADADAVVSLHGIGRPGHRRHC